MVNGTNLEKKTITFGKPLYKKDIMSFLSFLSENVSYDISNMGNLVRGIEIPIQNECSGTMVYREMKIPYRIYLHVDSVYHIDLSFPPAIDKEIIGSIEKKITEFFSTYPQDYKK